MIRGLLPSTMVVAGGALAAVGAALPWLTLYAGLQTYSGLIGIYGWAIFTLGIAMCIIGFAIPFVHKSWLGMAIALCGVGLCALTIWLFAGLAEIVNQPESVMLDARAGPGLNVILLAALVLIFGGLRLRRV